ncbi:dual oxidase 1-like protein 2 [Sarcoptes scabiei]|uniref:Dual oxidase 1-like protein 2 n=1 Tax=Sarcoptes scabiei TaxID=52283 RepID=A0A132AIT6_SARSC|nr:dual oxidase 1-like protein 2 [Sarcoptes scabiei]
MKPLLSSRLEYEDLLSDEDLNYPSINSTLSGQFYTLPNVFAYRSSGLEETRSNGDMFFKAEMQRYDGWYNNLAHPTWGTTESHLTRKAPPSYADGVYMMAGEDRPSPRDLSQALMRGDDGVASSRNLTTLFAFFGEFSIITNYSMD